MILGRVVRIRVVSRRVATRHVASRRDVSRCVEMHCVALRRDVTRHVVDALCGLLRLCYVCLPNWGHMALCGTGTGTLEVHAARRRAISQYRGK